MVRAASAAIVPLLAVVLTGPAVAEESEAAASRTSESSADTSANDPIEPVNRGIFWFNDKLDVYALEPTARAWHWAVPDPAERMFENFFDNLRFPIVVVNNLLQGKAEAGGITTARFLMNSSIGIGGLFDPASDVGLEPHPEDFGQTLGWWGAPPGPYLMFPFFGPSNVRDTGGQVVDYFITVYPYFVNSWVLFGGGVVRTLNGRAQILDEVTSAREASLDYYTFVRNAYFQRREALVRDQLVDESAPPADDLYDAVWDDDAPEKQE
jgi:phospholipid-binding lipoprotein MlaA